MYKIDDISISIVSHGHGKFIKKFLSDFKKNPSFKKIKIILTLNNRNEDFEIDSDLNLVIIRNHNNKGFGENHNNAFKQMNTKLFFVINPDIRIKENFFQSIIDELNQLNSFGVASPRIISSSGNYTDHVRENLSIYSLIKRHFLKDFSVKIKDNQFFWLSGCFHIFRQETFKKLHGYEEKYFMYCEDYDICARLHLENLEISVLEKIIAEHDAQRSSRRSLYMLLLHIKSLIQLWSSALFWKISFKK